MKLIVGLGNPGKEYENTRHNSGFLAIDRLADLLGVSLNQSKWNALIGQTNVAGEKVILMKPLTYMNESGQAVGEAVRFYHLDPNDLLIMHDDMDIPVGALRIREKGSAGGQKGMKSIISHIGTDEFVRIRIGVGHSERGAHDKVPDWVLSPVPKAEQETFKMTLDQAAKAAETWISEPMQKVMAYNIRPKKKSSDE